MRTHRAQALLRSCRCSSSDAGICSYVGRELRKLGHMPDPDSCLAARTPASAWMPLKSFNGSSFPNGVRAGRIGGCGGGGRRRSSLGRAATVKQTSGVPQGRVLRPRLFTAPLSAAGGIPTAGAVAPAAITGRSMALSMIPRRAREQFLAAPISPCRFALYSTVCTLCAGSYAGNTRREDQRKKKKNESVSAAAVSETEILRRPVSVPSLSGSRKSQEDQHVR